MQLKSCVLPLLALASSLAAANPLHLGYGEGHWANNLDVQVHKQGADPITINAEITQQDESFHRRRRGPVAIVPVKGVNKCLDVRNANFQNGNPVQIWDCNGTNAQKWVFDRRSGQVRVSGTNFCLDAGGAPRNGVGLKIWTCSHKIPAQTWRYRGNKTIQMRSANQCVALPRGSLANGKQIHIWYCNGDNRNQIWGLRL